MGTHQHMDSALRGLKIGSPKQPPTDVATQHRMPEEPPGGARWLHRKHSNTCFIPPTYQSPYISLVDLSARLRYIAFLLKYIREVVVVTR
jgi:hypothetical protein